MMYYYFFDYTKESDQLQKCWPYISLQWVKCSTTLINEFAMFLDQSKMCMYQ